jgi:hypothetical protein
MSVHVPSRLRFPVSKFLSRMIAAVLSRFGPYLLLAVLDLIFFGELVLHPSQVLYGDHSDLLALHVPAKTFLVESWRETGELPRWCPYEFAGTPFVHDIQVGALYPPHVVLYLLSPEYIGAALSWLIVAHVLVAGWGMYAYASREGLGFTGSLVAALGFMFAGRWMLHLLVGGHYIVIGLAWLPWVLLLLERAVRAGSLLWATAAGVVYALVVLGTQPQWTFYAGIFVALWTLGTATEHTARSASKERPLAGAAGYQRALVRWLACGAWTVAVAVGLCAVQLLPTIEAAGLSCRSQGVAATSGVQQICESIGLLFGPYRESTVTSWESQGGLGILWVTAAIFGAFPSRGRVRWQVLICGMLLLFALGGGQLLGRAPGFSLFRQPVRMVLIATIPLALLAGRGTEAVLTGAVPPRRGCLTLLGCIVLALGLLYYEREVLHDLPSLPPLYERSLVLIVAAQAPLLLFQRGMIRGAAWSLLLVLELWAISWPLVAVQPVQQIYPRSACVEFLASKHGDHGRILDYDRTKGPHTSPLGSGVPLALLHRLEALRGYSPLDVLRYKEYLLFITDHDHPLRALDGSFTFPVINDFPARNPNLLDLLGTRYILQPTARDADATRYHPVFRDDSPTVFDFVAGGIQRRGLGSFTVYENDQAMPRAFVVSRAAALPERSRVLAALKATDFRRTVLLEDYTPQPEAATAAEHFRPATILDYQPNRVLLSTDGDTPGWLVLTDIWYPGWMCEVDGEPAQVHRANYLFRAVRVPAGRHEIVFHFEPQSLQRGKMISAGTAILITLLALWFIVSRMRNAKR